LNADNEKNKDFYVLFVQFFVFHEFCDRSLAGVSDLHENYFTTSSHKNYKYIDRTVLRIRNIELYCEFGVSRTAL